MVAYFYVDVSIEDGFASSNGLCAAYHPQSFAFHLIACQDASKACNCSYLCEPVELQHESNGHGAPTSKTGLPGLSAISGIQSLTDKKFKAAVCPSGHLTHDFLSCDSRSACWAASDVRGARSRCLAPLSPLPPSFPCSDGVGTVPYSLVCDHRHDCSDSSDETFCHFPPCDSTNSREMFQCDNLQVGLLSNFLLFCPSLKRQGTYVTRWLERRNSNLKTLGSIPCTAVQSRVIQLVLAQNSVSIGVGWGTFFFYPSKLTLVQT